MIGKVRAGLVFGIIKVTCPNSSTVKVSQGSISFTKTGTSTEFPLPKTGTWTIKVTYNGLTETYTRTVSAGQTISITAMNNVALYHENTYCAGFTSGWNGWKYNAMVDQTTTYNPVASNHIEAHAESPDAWKIWARTKGAVNLTGFKYVRFGYNGFSEGANTAASKYAFRATDANGGVIAQSGYIGDGSGAWKNNQTYDLNVTNVNRAVYIEVYAEIFVANSAKADLYNIWLRA